MIVHVLSGGRPLCGFSPDVPAYWPRGHAWVSKHDDPSDVNCPGCRKQLYSKE